MIIASVAASSNSIAFRFFMLWLAWAVLLSFSWVDLKDAPNRMGFPLTDFQQATEPDLDEVRADVIADLEVPAIDPVSIDPSFEESIPLAAPPIGLSRAAFLSKLSVYRI